MIITQTPLRISFAGGGTDLSAYYGRDPEVGDGIELARYLLEQARVAVVPGEAFGAPNHVRISYATSLEQIREGMERIEQALGELPQG